MWIGKQSCRVALIPLVFCVTACGTTTQMLRLERDNLVLIRNSETAIRDAATQQAYDPSRYDLHLFLNSVVFNEILQGFDDTRFVVGDSRPIDVTIAKVRFEFRPGYPNIQISATARDRKSGAEADLIMAAALTIESDSSDPGSLYLRVVATEVVPNIKWGPLDFSKWAFARRLLQLEGLRFAERIPRVKLPVEKAFELGGPAAERLVTLPTGRGSISGIVRVPDSQVSGTVAVKHVLFLKNGVHILANVEGL